MARWRGDGCRTLTAGSRCLLAGRWKPLHYWLKSSIYTDVMATCGAGGLCYVRVRARCAPLGSVNGQLPSDRVCPGGADRCRTRARAQNDSPFPASVTTTFTLVSFGAAAAKQIYTRSDALPAGPGALSWFILPGYAQLRPSDSVLLIDCHQVRARCEPRLRCISAALCGQGGNLVSHNQLLLAPPSQLAVAAGIKVWRRSAAARSGWQHPTSHCRSPLL